MEKQGKEGVWGRNTWQKLWKGFGSSQVRKDAPDCGVWAVLGCARATELSI